MADEHSPLDDALDALAAARPDYIGCSCGVARIMSEVPEATAERLRHLIDETRVSTTSIAEKLAAAGFPISHQSVQRHRRRLTKPGSGCRCEP